MTPGRERDHAIDAVRVVAMAGVVGGHWLVTGLRIDGEGAWRQVSPLAVMPDLAPVSWLLQTLGLFFFAGGFAAARSVQRRSAFVDVRGSAEPPTAGRRVIRFWDRRGNFWDRLGNLWGRRENANPETLRRTPRGARRLVLPLAGLLGFWAMVLGIAAAIGTPAATLRTIAVLVISPLWFLLPYLALRAGTAPLIKIVDRAGRWAVVVPAVGVVAASDLGLAPGWLAVAAAWCVPWVLGIALAQDRLGTTPAQDPSRAGPTPAADRPCSNPTPAQNRPHSNPTPAQNRPRPDSTLGQNRPHSGLALLLAGAGAMAVLIGGFGYPVSAVGVPGDGRSNLSPPSLLAVALALAQVGAFLLVRDRLSGPPGRLAGSMNRAALPIFLSHQSVLIAVAATASAIAGQPAPGLLTTPAGPLWIMQRVAWLPLLALVLAAVIKPRWRTTRRAWLP